MFEAAGSGRSGSPPSGQALSVCGFSEAVLLGQPEADGMLLVPPAHPLIAYTGRVDCSTKEAVGFAHAGAAVRLRFTGKALDFSYRDHGNETPTGTNYFMVSVDQRAPFPVKLSPKQERYAVVRNLPEGDHVVEMFKRTESGQLGQPGVGRGEFLGFRVDQGSELLPLPPRAHRIEFIGDSITCGYGTELTTTEPQKHHYSSRNSSAYASWAAVTARRLDADLMLVAYSGRGVSRNYQSVPGDLLPALYPKTLPDDPKSPLWNFAAFTPEVVVINLGTNDFSPGGVDRERFRKAYAAFLETLRGHYPDATLILAVGPMMSDYYPPNESAWTNIQADVGALVEARRTAGDHDVHVLVLPTQTGPFGEDWHPTVMQQASMASRAVELIGALRNF
jgi:lysophospholipase L1-like esterase